MALTLLLAACAGVPPVERGQPSRAIPIGQSTFLDREGQRELANQPGVSAVRLVQQNPLALAYRLETARRAERSLDLQYYIWHDDYTGKLLAAEVLQAAERGVRVRLLLDDLDVHERRETLVIADRHPNLEVRVFNPIIDSSGPLSLVAEVLARGRTLNHRMHNKLWIADNRVAIVGGRNIGDEYFGVSAHANFSDTGLIMGGPAVEQASAIFDEYWNSAAVVPVTALAAREPAPAELQGLVSRAAEFAVQAGDAPDAVTMQQPGKLAEYLARRPPQLKATHIRLVADDPRKVEGTAKGRAASPVLDAVYRMIEGAAREVLIVSPYFVPGEKGVADLASLVQRGVRVVVLTNSLAATDVVGVHAAYSDYRKSLLRGGVELYEMKRTAGDERGRRRISLAGSSQASLHSKLVMVDRSRVFIGSMNLDPRSVNINTEMGALLESSDLGAQLLESFESSIGPEMSHRVVLDSRRGLAWHDREQGQDRVLHAEPDASPGRRLVARLLKLLPLESQL